MDFHSPSHHLPMTCSSNLANIILYVNFSLSLKYGQVVIIDYDCMRK